MPKIVVIVPAYNEATSLPDVIADVRAHRPDDDIVVVSDGSTDDTVAVARSLGVPALDLAINLGIGGAVQTGFRYALEMGYDYAVQFDGDGQHRGEELTGVIEAAVAGEADIVIGSRFVKATGYRAPAARRLGMRFFSILTSVLIGQRICDTSSGMRCINRRVIEYFAHDYPVDYPDAEALLYAHFRGFTFKEVPVGMRPRQHGKSSINFMRQVFYPFRVLVGIASLLTSYLALVFRNRARK